ncbi:MAG: hypothetical protein FD167_5371 [bacterium]|nr:MAG: hypothetical protein FD167_5371 [bacterium]
MSAQPLPLDTIFQQAATLSSEDKKALADRLLADVSEQDQRDQQRIKNQAALEFHKQLLADDSGYEEENAQLIDEAIAATIKNN